MTVWGTACSDSTLAGMDLSIDSETLHEAAVYQYLPLLTSLKDSSKLLKEEENTRKSLKRAKNPVNLRVRLRKVNKFVFYGKATYDKL